MMNIERKWSKDWVFRGLAAMTIGTLIYLAVVPKPVLVDAATVTRGSFRETIQADGILRSRERYIVPAFASGDIKRIALRVGDSIKKGQEITELFWDIKWHSVRSPITGVISKVFHESAGPIQRGEPIVEVIDPTRLEVVADLLTTDATRVSVGNPATVKGWGDKGELAAKVIRISKAGFTKQSALGVEEEKTEVTLDPAELPEALLSRLGSTFHVDVSIQVSETKDALKLPSGALFRNGEYWAVYKVESGRARAKNIEIKARSSQEVMIGGLNAGDTVVLFPGDLVRENARVRIRGLEK